MTEQLDTQGEAREALSSMVNDYSKRILTDPRMLGNVVTDLLPDLPRERRLLVTVGVAGGDACGTGGGGDTGGGASDRTR